MIGFLDLEEPPRLEPPEIIPRHGEVGGRESLLADCRKLNWPMRKSAPSCIQVGENFTGMAEHEDYDFKNVNTVVIETASSLKTV